MAVLMERYHVIERMKRFYLGLTIRFQIDDFFFHKNLSVDWKDLFATYILKAEDTNDSNNQETTAESKESTNDTDTNSEPPSPKPPKKKKRKKKKKSAPPTESEPTESELTGHTEDTESVTNTQDEIESTTTVTLAKSTSLDSNLVESEQKTQSDDAQGENPASIPIPIPVPTTLSLEKEESLDEEELIVEEDKKEEQANRKEIRSILDTISEEESFVLEMRHISKNIGRISVLKDMHLMVQKDCILGLLGDSGAGKTMLLNCLFGLTNIDSGEILMGGKKVFIRNRKKAVKRKMMMVHQDMQYVPNQTVAEYIWLGHFPKFGSILNTNSVYNRTRRLFKKWEFRVSPRKKMKQLNVYQRRIVDVMKALSYQPSILLLDEPTAYFTPPEITYFFDVLRTLKEQGMVIIYSSNEPETMLQIADEITIMKDGTFVGTETVNKELNLETTRELMTGKIARKRYPKKKNIVLDDISLKLENFTGKRSLISHLKCKEINLELHKGEVLGITGMEGSGKTELLETIFGVCGLDDGEIYKDGKHIYNLDTSLALLNGFAFLSEDKIHGGMFLKEDIFFNAVASNVGAYEKYKLLSHKEMSQDMNWIQKALNVDMRVSRVSMRDLSSGDQQKILLGRCLLTNPDILLLDEPTNCMDIESKFDIQKAILEFAKKKKSVIMVSTDMYELERVCDRVVVMSNGRIVEIIDGEDVSQEDVLKLTSSYI